jgi:BlaI family transcriptional regulator, penicillinase repressor
MPATNVPRTHLGCEEILTMARSTTGRPTDLELELLKVLWQRGPSTVREVLAAMSDLREIGYTTVLKMLQIMRDKGLVQCDTRRRPQVYRPRQSRQVVLKQLAGDLLQRAFGGSTRQLLLHALETKRKCPPEELAELRGLLDEIERSAL